MSSLRNWREGIQARQAAETAADVLFGQAAPTNTNTDKIKDAMAEVAPILERHGLKAMQPTAASEDLLLSLRSTI